MEQGPAQRDVVSGDWLYLTQVPLAGGQALLVDATPWTVRGTAEAGRWSDGWTNCGHFVRPWPHFTFSAPPFRPHRNRNPDSFQVSLPALFQPLPPR